MNIVKEDHTLITKVSIAGLTHYALWSLHAHSPSVTIATKLTCEQARTATRRVALELKKQQQLTIMTNAHIACASFETAKHLHNTPNNNAGLVTIDTALMATNMVCPHISVARAIMAPPPSRPAKETGKRKTPQTASVDPAPPVARDVQPTSQSTQLCTDLRKRPTYTYGCQHFGLKYICAMDSRKQSAYALPKISVCLVSHAQNAQHLPLICQVLAP